MKTSVAAYNALIESGFIGSQKRDVLIEATDDNYDFGLVHSLFLFHAGAAARASATACTILLIEELVEQDLCAILPSSSCYIDLESPDGTPVKLSHEELVRVVERYADPKNIDFDYCLVATESGRDWVRRYYELLSEIEDR